MSLRFTFPRGRPCGNEPRRWRTPGTGRLGYMGDPARLQAVTRAHTHMHILLHKLTLTRAHSLPGGLRPGALPAPLAPCLWDRPLPLWGDLLSCDGRKPLEDKAEGAGSRRHLAVWEKGIQEDGRDCQGPSKGSPAGPGHGAEDAGEGHGRDRGWKKMPSLLLHSLQLHCWGRSPGHRKPGEHQGVPCVLGRH